MKLFNMLSKKKPEVKPDFRLYYCSDVHGSEQCFLKFLNSAKYYGADAIIMGGDITGKQMIPIIRYPDGHYEADLLGRTRQAAIQKEVEELEKNIRFNGMYPYHCDLAELNLLQEDENYRKKVFKELMVGSVERWINMADERLNGKGTACFIMPGNDDLFEIDEIINKAKFVVNPDNKVVYFNGYQMLSMSECNPTPWNSPREESEEDLETRLNSLIALLDPNLPTIFNLHAPPYKSTLDDAPSLTDDLRPITQGGNIVTIPVGSIAVRRAIEKFQPFLALHGHIHESRGATYIGRTLCINPGSEYHDGVLHGVLLGLQREEVCMHQLITG